MIVKDPVTVEKDPNDSRMQAQEVALPATVCGTIEKGEDVDWYKFKVEAGHPCRSSSSHHDCRTRSTICRFHSDPIITVRNARGRHWPGRQ